MIITTLFMLHILTGVTAYGAEFLSQKKQTGETVLPLLSATLILGAILALFSTETTATTVALHAVVFTAPLAVIHVYRTRQLAFSKLAPLGVAHLCLVATVLLGA